jgi:hypothetical protein
LNGFVSQYFGFPLVSIFPLFLLPRPQSLLTFSQWCSSEDREALGRSAPFNFFVLQRRNSVYRLHFQEFIETLKPEIYLVSFSMSYKLQQTRFHYQDQTPFREIIAVYCENYTKCGNIPVKKSFCLFLYVSITLPFLFVTFCTSVPQEYCMRPLKMIMMIRCTTLYPLGPDIGILVSVLLFRNILYSPQEHKPYENIASPDKGHLWGFCTM